MGYYNYNVETNLPFAAQPPTKYDEDYMKRLVSVVNRLVQVSGGSNEAINAVPASVIPATVATTVSAIATGSSAVIATITIPGALPSNPVSVAVSPALPAGVYAIGKVSAADTATVEIFNQSGSSYSGSISLTLAVITS